jgi:hypothetical protein
MKETPKGLYKLKKKDIRSVGPILKNAFQHDPVWNKLFEGEKTAEKKLSAFFEVPVRFCMKFGEVYASSENFEGIAAWVPGDRGEMTIRRRLIRAVIEKSEKLEVPLYLETETRENVKMYEKYGF